jgi:hypothetical protein
VAVDSSTGRSKGFAFVTFDDAAAAEEAVEKVCMFACALFRYVCERI